MTIVSRRVTVRLTWRQYRKYMRYPGRTGYTLIEVMLALSVMAILSAMALPRIGITRFYADEGMRTLQAALQQAQRTAVMRQSDVMVSFDTAGRRVRIVLDANDNHQVDPGESVRWHSLEDGTRFATPPAGIQCAGGTPVCGNNIASRDGFPTLFFHRDGAVSSDAEIYIRSYSQDVDDFRALAVAQATGRVELYTYGGGMWRRASL